jgi:hypothetical protein
VKPDHEPRGARPHHTEVYPKSLLGGLLHCGSCGSRLWIQGSGDRAYMGCPNRRKGLCSQAGRVPVARGEKALLDFVAALLSSWPSWVEEVSSTMRIALAKAARRLPEALRADEVHLASLEKQIENLVDHLAEGSSESPALRRRLDYAEREADALRGRIAEGRRARESAIAMPDDAWIRSQLAELPTLLADEPRRTTDLLRRLVGRVTAEEKVAPGKSRGFIHLRFRVDASQILEAALGGRLPESVLEAAKPTSGETSMEFRLDLGGPTRSDVLAPEIAVMRARGVTWPEIGRVTGLGTGNAYKAWKRWTEAARGERLDPA